MPSWGHVRLKAEAPCRGVGKCDLNYTPPPTLTNPQNPPQAPSFPTFAAPLSPATTPPHSADPSSCEVPPSTTHVLRPARNASCLWPSRPGPQRASHACPSPPVPLELAPRVCPGCPSLPSESAPAEVRSLNSSPEAVWSPSPRGGVGAKQQKRPLEGLRERLEDVEVPT